MASKRVIRSSTSIGRILKVLSGLTIIIVIFGTLFVFNAAFDPRVGPTAAVIALVGTVAYIVGGIVSAVLFWAAGVAIDLLDEIRYQVSEDEPDPLRRPRSHIPGAALPTAASHAVAPICPQQTPVFTY